MPAACPLAADHSAYACSHFALELVFALVVCTVASAQLQLLTGFRSGNTTRERTNCCAEHDALLQIVGTYSESASDDQNAALKQVALTKPNAPSKDELKSMGYDFALKV